MQRYLNLFSVMALLSVAAARCEAVEPPTLPELKQASAQLRADASRVQGTFQAFHDDKTDREALEKLPADIGLPLVRSGTLWRDGDTIRVDYTTHRPQGETQNAVAVSGGDVFEFSAGDEHGMLQVYRPESPAARTHRSAIERAYFEPLDSLWGFGGVPYFDLLQRPDADLVSNQTEVLRDGFSIRVTVPDGTTTHFEFAAEHPHPFGYSVSDTPQPNAARLERRVTWAQRERATLPTRVVQIVSLGLSQTTVVEFDLEPLKPNSPIAGEMTPNSFRNLGGYQVYYHTGDGQQLGERYEGVR